MLNFKEAIIEYKYFDQNRNQVITANMASIIIGRTKGNTFGDYWHAIHVGEDAGYRIGQAKTIESAVKIGSTRVISDAAMLAVIEIKRGDPYHANNRYSQDVYVNDLHVATFTPSYGRQYTLRDISGEVVSVKGDGHHRVHSAKVSAKYNMMVTVRRWLELIPNDDDIADRKAADLAADEALAAEIAEGKRIDLIKDHAEELLTALVNVLADLKDCHTHGDRSNIDIADNLIAKARGE